MRISVSVLIATIVANVLLAVLVLRWRHRTLHLWLAIIVIKRLAYLVYHLASLLLFVGCFQAVRMSVSWDAT